MKSSFEKDLSKEQRLTHLLDSYYRIHLKRYDFKRVQAMRKQMQGIDLVLKNRSSHLTYNVDEKAQLDYVNENLPTFAFELFYHRKGIQKLGWLFDNAKKTDFYALVTGIFSDEDGKYTSCNITFVNRSLLINHLLHLNLTKENLEQIVFEHPPHHGKMELEQLSSKKQGYLYFSTQNKAEKPVNLILRLDYLINVGIAKKLV